MAGGGSGSWLVPDGVQSTDVEPVVAQRWLQHRRDDFFGRGGIGPQSLHSGKSTDTVESRGTAGVFDLIEPVIGGRFEMAHDGGPLRGDEDGGVPARGSTSATLYDCETESAARSGWFGNRPPIPEFIGPQGYPLMGTARPCRVRSRRGRQKRPIPNADPHGMGGVGQLPGSEIQSRFSGRNGSRWD